MNLMRNREKEMRMRVCMYVCVCAYVCSRERTRREERGREEKRERERDRERERRGEKGGGESAVVVSDLHDKNSLVGHSNHQRKTGICHCKIHRKMQQRNTQNKRKHMQHIMHRLNKPV